ncbi:MAG TPA: phosphoglycolate phosphatase [Verrucomicrobiae bacterium]|nr:phosphoglycolate phosphatase [Verrucomicrobiae bacterium]
MRLTENGVRPRFSPRCILFDLDGTLVDTAPDLGYAANQVRAEVGLPPLPEEQYRPVASAGARGLLKVGLDLTPDHPEFPARRESFLKHYRANLARGSRLFAGVDEVLRGYERAGIAWGVVTNKPQWLTDPLMAALALDQRAACVIGQVDGQPVKPSPEPLLRACRALNFAPADCVYVGDDLRDVQAARAAGMPVVAAAWGYLGDAEPIEQWRADAVYQTPAELSRLCP